MPKVKASRARVGTKGGSAKQGAAGPQIKISEYKAGNEPSLEEIERRFTRANPAAPVMKQTGTPVGPRGGTTGVGGATRRRQVGIPTPPAPPLPKGGRRQVSIPNPPAPPLPKGGKPVPPVGGTTGGGRVRVQRAGVGTVGRGPNPPAPRLKRGGKPVPPTGGGTTIKKKRRNRTRMPL